MSAEQQEFEKIVAALQDENKLGEIIDQVKKAITEITQSEPMLVPGFLLILAMACVFQQQKNTGLTGQQLKWLRNACGLSQVELANAIGVTQGSISAWEAGKEGISSWHIPAIRAAISNAAKTMTQSMPAMLAVAQPPIGSPDLPIDSMSAEEFSQLRRESGLSQRQIAAALDTSQAVVWRWEKAGVSRRKAAAVRRVFAEHQAAPKAA